MVSEPLILGHAIQPRTDFTARLLGTSDDNSSTDDVHNGTTTPISAAAAEPPSLEDTLRNPPPQLARFEKQEKTRVGRLESYCTVRADKRAFLINRFFVRCLAIVQNGRPIGG